jgi:hypothetical protein
MTLDINNRWIKLTRICMIFPVNRKIVGCLLLWMKNDTFLDVILWFASDDKALTTTLSSQLNVTRFV